jgi:hypothetical protein
VNAPFPTHAETADGEVKASFKDLQRHVCSIHGFTNKDQKQLEKTQASLEPSFSS